MKTYFRYLIVCLPFCLAMSLSVIAQDVKLWYNKPAIAWEEALPLGNAKMGAMVFGGLETEHYQLNDNTLWSGYPSDGNNRGALAVLPEVRKAILEEKYTQAENLWKKMQGPYSASYLPMGDLWLHFQHGDSSVSNYYRELSLDSAVSKVRYRINDINYIRESFISRTDGGLVLRISADRPGAISFKMELTSKLKHTVIADLNGQMVLKGVAPSYIAKRDFEPRQVVYNEPLGEGMRFEIHAAVHTSGGTVANENGQVNVRGADEVLVFLTDATSFAGFDKSPGLQGVDAHKAALKGLQELQKQSFKRLKKEHVQDHSSLFNRVAISLGGDPVNTKRTTDERIRRFSAGESDNGLLELYYQFGRYLLIASSRPGGPPANLQGLWNNDLQPPWGSNYTMNINTQMNYWLAENTNLAECHVPLFDFIGELAVNGAQTARVNYGINNGWLSHHNSDIWAKTSPTGGYTWDPKGMPRWSAWPMSGAWLSCHLWEHYLYSEDLIFLSQKAYPLMRGAAVAMLEWLVDDPTGKYLITIPSTSPENTVKIKGKEYQLSMASTMDMAIIRELFSACIAACELLAVDEPFKLQLQAAMERLYPYHIGGDGQLQEWYKDWDDPQDKHRHISHLFGLYPGNQISTIKTPELAAAAKRTLLDRGDESTGWSMAWKTNWWARLFDGNHAYKILKDALHYIDPREQRGQMSGGGAYPNLFDAHPPFQIDGNFGATAGITEMLMQSHASEIHLLPALPDRWPQGYISGIRARGNFSVNIKWNEGKLHAASIHSGNGGVCRVRSWQPLVVRHNETEVITSDQTRSVNEHKAVMKFFNNTQGSLLELDIPQSYEIEFETKPGLTYQLTPLIGKESKDEYEDVKN
ncbi:glycoside hydrolase N-terminal domain-containing protein [Sphingobacterium sp. JB170]|uniref:glycoside hydrolase family 95 protein n=1 Tax=Sphingobacterium sp. JB170 TaxID=1434842 RepID=UPI000B35758D|nr:glycoside hydrolase family 95 protein [Sphingobacterium sp. JB170]